jgi:hypothetical protein
MSTAGRKSKRLPLFGEFVRQSKHAHGVDDVEGWVSALVLAGTIGAGWFAWRYTGWYTIPLAVIFGAPTVAWLATSISNRIHKRSELELERLNKLKPLMRSLKGYLDSSRLHRHIQPIAAALFEECARNWQRIQESLNGPAWTQSNLPQHWKNVKYQSLQASELAMEDVVLLLQTSIVSQPKNEEWQTVFADFLRGLMGQEPTASDVDHFPAEYEAAREVAWKLQRLANEVESATKRLLLDEGVRKQFSSGDSLDLVLSELRAIQEAENELQERITS